MGYFCLHAIDAWDEMLLLHAYDAQTGCFSMLMMRGKGSVCLHAFEALVGMLLLARYMGRWHNLLMRGCMCVLPFRAQGCAANSNASRLEVVDCGAPGYAAYGNNSRLEVADCSWSPQPPPKMLQGASRHYRPSLPEWLR
eukprot:scaffold47963_cov19-Tisochrysis_lutea.AAC.1